MSGFFAGSGQVEMSGSGTTGVLNGAVTVACPAAATLIFVLSGTWSATQSFEGTADGSVWFPVTAALIPSTASTVSTTANNVYAIAVGGLAAFRVRTSAYVSGTATVTWNMDTSPNRTLSPAPILGATDGSVIGNVADSLKTTVTSSALPSGAATEATLLTRATSAIQATQQTSLTSIDTKLTSQATAANQTTGNASLSSIDTKLSSQATAANQTTEITALQLIDNPVGSVAPGTAGTSSFLSGAVYNTSAPTATNGQQLAHQADINGKLKVVDICDGGGLSAALTVGTSAVLACANGAASNLANRKSLTVFNNGTVLVYWGLSNAVTTSTGTPITPGSQLIFTIGSNTSIYLISGTASQNTRISEIA